MLNKSSWPILISKVFSGLPKSPRNHLLTSKKMQNNDKCGNKSEICSNRQTVDTNLFYKSCGELFLLVK